MTTHQATEHIITLKYSIHNNWVHDCFLRTAHQATEYITTHIYNTQKKHLGIWQTFHVRRGVHAAINTCTIKLMVDASRIDAATQVSVDLCSQ
jgi:hypothetical protein